MLFRSGHIVLNCACGTPKPRPWISQAGGGSVLRATACGIHCRNRWLQPQPGLTEEPRLPILQFPQPPAEHKGAHNAQGEPGVCEDQEEVPARHGACTAAAGAGRRAGRRLEGQGSRS
jgi:hypothetical protein